MLLNSDKNYFVRIARHVSEETPTVIVPWSEKRNRYETVVYTMQLK